MQSCGNTVVDNCEGEMQEHELTYVRTPARACCSQLQASVHE